MKPLAFKYGKGGKTGNAHGNRVQPKLSVNKPGDSYEKEADKMAEEVIRKSRYENTSMVAKSLKPKEPAKDEEISKAGSKQVMRKAMTPSGYAVSPIPGIGEATGSRLPESTKCFMENAFQTDFSEVRIHTGAEAEEFNNNIQAKAATHGRDIYFNRGQFSPHTDEGKKLLAHELTHVIQQRATNATPDIQRVVELRPPGRREASAFARVQELIDRLNAQSPAIQYRLDGRVLKYDVINPAGLTHFDLQMQGFIDRAEVIPMRLINRSGLLGGDPLWVDDLQEAYLDLDDMLACTDLSFQMNLIHLLVERFNVRNYARRIGMADVGAQWSRVHPMGLQAEAEHLRAIIGDPTIRFSYETNRIFVFRSAEGYRIVHLFHSNVGGVRRGEVYVIRRNGTRTTIDQLILERNAAAAPVLPKLMVGQRNDSYEREADAMAEKVVNGSSPEKFSPVTQRTNTSHGFEAPSSIVYQLKNNTSDKSALPADTRLSMENAFAYDFSAVRVHTGNEAIQMNQDLSAKAFTYGSHIYFNRGQYAPTTIEGKKLLAHELTHVVQNTDESVIRRMEDLPAQIAKTPAANDNKKAPWIDLESKYLYLPTISMPNFKERNAKKIRTPIHSASTKSFDPKKPKSGSTEGDTKQKGKRIQTAQRDNWRKLVESGVRSKVHDMFEKTAKDIDGYYFLKSISSSYMLIGTFEEVIKESLIPFWGRDGKIRSHQVDHIEELQLGGADQNDNYELLDASANSSSGGVILGERGKRIKAGLKAIEDQQKAELKKPVKNTTAPKNDNTANPNAEEKPPALPTTQEVLANYITIFARVADWSLKGNKGDGKNYYWSADDIMKGKHLQQLRPMTQKERDALQGDENHLAILLSSSAMRPPKKVKINFTGDDNGAWIKGFNLQQMVDYNADAEPGKVFARLKGELFRKQKGKKIIKDKVNVKIPVIKVAGVLSLAKLEGKLKDYIEKPLESPVMSPIDIIDGRIDEQKSAMILDCNILPSIPLLKDLDLDMYFEGDDVVISKTFTAEELKGKVPQPFEITSGEITILASLNDGFGVDGRLDFIIKNIGSGFIGASKRKGIFELKGGFDFDKGLFDESHIDVSYLKEEDKPAEFTLHGRALKKASKKNKAIKSAELNVDYEKDVLTARGTVITNLSAIKQGSIEVVSNAAGTSVIADFILGDSIPGVAGGNVHFQFNKKGEDEYSIDATAAVQTKFSVIPNVTLHGVYKSDGTFLFEGDADLVPGKRFRGKVHFGITNREVGKDGKLTEKLGDGLIAFGSGEVDYQMTDWLHGKIGAVITPDARVILAGELRPDPVLPITKKPYEINPRKTLGQFNLPKFTLFGIPHVAEIFVTASGGLYFDASIGPLYLKNAVLGFDELDIDDPGKTKVHGQGDLDIPAQAAVTFEAKIEAGLGILVVDVRVGIGGSISFAIIGNAGLHLGFNWSNEKGFKLENSFAYLKAKTELIAVLKGSVSVNLDLLLTTINLYYEDWKMGEKRWPLGLDIDVNFPLEFGEGDTGDFKVPSADKLEPKHPEFDKGIVTKAAMEEAEPPTPPPTKEEALARTRVLPAIAGMPANWITKQFERYNYIASLKKKHPSQEWGFLDAEAKRLDDRDFDRLSQNVLSSDFPGGEFGKKLRLAAVSVFDEEHLYVSGNKLAELVKQIRALPD